MKENEICLSHLMTMEFLQAFEKFFNGNAEAFCKHANNH